MSLLTADFIFSDEQKHRIARHTVFWLINIAFFTLVYGSKPIGSHEQLRYEVILHGYRLSFVECLSYLPMHIFLSYMFMYVLIPNYLFKGKYLSFLALLGGCVLFVASLSYFITLWIIVPFREHIGIAPPFSSFYFGLMGGLRGGLSVAGFTGAIKVAKHWYYKNQLNQQLEAEKLKTELQLLKAQVHPHFLFNTLNNLYSLTLLKSDQAPEVVLKLSGLLRFMLYECNAPQVPLAKELSIIYDYIELEKLRYGNRLDLSVNIKGNAKGKYIAPLLLIPFLENSFKHGASEQLDQAWISLDIAIHGKTLKFKLLNAIPVTEQGKGINTTGGIGLQNVRKRLNLLYRDRYKLKVTQEEETFLVVLTLELDQEPDSQSSITPDIDTHKPEIKPSSINS